jgi:hypothetical protein
MFQHAYNGYLKYAYPYDELRPLSCDGVDTWGRYSVYFSVSELPAGKEVVGWTTGSF